MKGKQICLGRVHSEETKEKIRSAHIGKTHSEETKAKIKAKRALQICSPETRAKMSAARMGEKNPFYGKKLTDEQKQHLKEINTGKNHPQYGKPKSIETKHKISIANSKENHYNYGKTLSEETKEKISNSITGEKNPNWIGGKTEYCHIFKSGTFRHRVRAYWNNVCQLCNKPAYPNESLDVHHVYYNKKACCEISPDGKYYSDLGFKGKPKTFEIIGEPNKFVPLHHECHSVTTAKTAREYFARYFEKLINEENGGKCYLTEDEYHTLAYSVD